jgi:hypothetical protein
MVSSLRLFDSFIPVPFLSGDTRFPSSWSAAGRTFRWLLFSFWVVRAPRVGLRWRWFLSRAQSAPTVAASRPPARYGRKSQSWLWRLRGSTCFDQRAGLAFLTL